MLKSFRFILTVILSLAVLAACNTAEDSTTESTKETVTASTETQESNHSVETEEPATTEVKQEETAAEEPASNDATSITYSSNGESKTEELTTVSNDQYAIRVIPGFTLTAEEPGKDVLAYDEDDTVSMRIEAMSKQDSTYEDLLASTEQTIAAISDDYEEYDISSFIKNNNVTNSKAYLAKFGSEEVIAVAFEKGDKLVRLTVFDQEQVDLSEAMIKMGLTIE